MIPPGTTQTIEAQLVHYVRAGVKDELDASTDDIQDQLRTTIDSPTLHSTFARFDDSRTLFEFVGFVDDPEQADMVIDLSRWSTLLLRVLEAQHDAEVRRLQDAAVDNFMLSLRDVPALEALISSIRKKSGMPPRARRDQRYESLRRLVRCRKGRRYGDG